MMLYDSDVKDFVAATGFKVEPFEQEALQRAVVRLKEAGIWDKRELLYVGALLDTDACLYNLASPYKYKLMPFGTPLRGGGGGYTGDHTSDTYLDTGFDFSDNHPNYSQNSASIFVYLPPGWSSSGSRSILATTDATYITLRANDAGVARFRLNNSTGTNLGEPLPSEDEGYFLGAVRSSEDHYQPYIQAEAVAPGLPRTSTEPVAGTQLRILKTAEGTSHGNQVAFVWLGGALTEEQVGTMYTVFEDLYKELYTGEYFGSRTISVQNKNEAMAVRYFRAPTVLSPDKIIVTMHGTGRNSRSNNLAAWQMSSRYNAVVITPEFDSERFSNVRYHRLNIVASEGDVNDSSEWTSRIIQRVYRDIKKRLNLDVPVYMIGHSAGGQITHRMALFDPLDVERFIASNSGSYTQLWEDYPYTQGLQDLPLDMRDNTALAAYVSRPLTIYIGTEDTATPDEDSDVPSIEGAMAQGGNRYERAQFMYSNGQSVANQLSVPFKWTYVEAPNIGHSSYGMYSRNEELDAAFGFSES